jgi:hypothetical protein
MAHEHLHDIGQRDQRSGIGPSAKAMDPLTPG